MSNWDLVKRRATLPNLILLNSNGGHCSREYRLVKLNRYSRALIKEKSWPRSKEKPDRQGGLNLRAFMPPKPMRCLALQQVLRPTQLRHNTMPRRLTLCPRAHRRRGAVARPSGRA